MVFISEKQTQAQIVKIVFFSSFWSFCFYSWELALSPPTNFVIDFIRTVKVYKLCVCVFIVVSTKLVWLFLHPNYNFYIAKHFTVQTTFSKENNNKIPNNWNKIWKLCSINNLNFFFWFTRIFLFYALPNATKSSARVSEQNDHIKTHTHRQITRKIKHRGKKWWKIHNTLRCIV